MTPHFTLDELTFSQTAVRKSIENKPDKAQTENLRQLCLNVLEPLREALERPIIISSGYRSPRLNKAIGGSARSQHCKGEAADIVVPGMDAKDVALKIVELGLPVDQLILEGGRWVHVSYSSRNRGEVLTAHFGPQGTQYFQGIRSV